MKKLRKRLMSWLMVFAFVFSTFAPFMPMTVSAAGEYAATLENVDLNSKNGTAIEGYNQDNFSHFLPINVTGTKPIELRSKYLKVEFTSGDTTAFVANCLYGSTLAPGSNYNAGSIKPVSGLSAGTYKATYTLFYDEDGDGTAKDWVALDSKEVTFTVTAPVSPTKHLVIFQNGINNITIKAVYVNDGNKVTKPTNPTMINRTFDNWYADAGMTIPFDFANTKINAETTIYAKFILNSDAPQYAAALEDVYLNYRSGDGTLKVAEIGYDQNYFSHFLPINVTGSKSIELNSKYLKVEFTSGNTTAFVANCLSGGSLSPGGNYNAGSIKPVSGLSAGTYKATYTLFYDEDGDGTAKDWVALDSKEVTFTVSTSTQKTVTFYDRSEMKVLNAVQVNKGEKVTRPSTDPKKNGFRFDNWYAYAAYGTLFDFDKNINENTTIYARFIEQVKVIYDVNGGTKINLPDGLMDNEEVINRTTYENKFKNTSLVTPPTNKELDYLEINGTKWTTDTYTVEGDITIKAIWKDKAVTPTQHTVTYDFNGGTPGSISSSFQVNDGEKIDFDYLKFQIKNYVTAPTGKEFYNFAIDGNAWNSGEYTVTKPITLKVQWDFIPSTPKHAITFDFNGGTSSLSVSPVNEGSKLKFDTFKKIVELNVTPPAANKVFDAFEIGGTRWDSGEYEVTAPITLKILWKEKVIRTVTFINGIDSSTISTTTVNDGKKVTRPTTDPTMANYTFDNWYADAGMTIPFDFDTPITAHTPIYAKFIPNSVTPTYVIESGANQTYTIDSNVDVVIKASGAKANLSKIQIDGTDLDTANYTAEEGSTILTLKASYLNTLSEGDHAVKFVYNDGDVSTNLKVVKNTTGGNTGGNTNPSGTNTGGNTGTNTNNNTSSPQTSDNIVFYIMTMLLSLFGIAGASVYVNRKKLFNR